MAGNHLISTLHHLAQIDVDAIRAYGQAMDHCQDPEVARLLSAFQDDHERHVCALGAIIGEMGGDTPAEPDIPGFAIAGFTAVFSNMGLSGMMMVMESNEIVTNDAYRQALSQDLPDRVRKLVECNVADERRHLETIRRHLECMPAGDLLSQAAAIHGATTATWVNAVRRNMPMALALGVGAAWLLGSLGNPPAKVWPEMRS